MVDEITPRRMRDVLTPTTEPTRKQTRAIQEVRDLATEVAAGRLPIDEIRRLCVGPQRYLATRYTPPEHAMFGPLMAMLDALIASANDPETGGRQFRTAQGLISEQELRDNGARIERSDGRELIVWPVRSPWFVKPNADRNEPGIRGEAIYRAASERSPERATVGNQPVTRQRAERPWWEDADDA